MKKIVIALAFLSAGCTTIGHVPAPNDWPQLRVMEHYVKVGVIWGKCYPTVPMWMKLLGGIPEGCAWIDLSKMSCDIYIPEGTPKGDRVLTHEREHCMGRDHANSTQLADLWDGWKERMTTGGAAYVFVRHDGTPMTINREK